MGMSREPAMCNPTDKSMDETPRDPFCVKVIGTEMTTSDQGGMAKTTVVRGCSIGLSMGCMDGPIEFNGVTVKGCVHACTEVSDFLECPIL